LRLNDHPLDQKRIEWILGQPMLKMNSKGGFEITGGYLDDVNYIYESPIGAPCTLLNYLFANRSNNEWQVIYVLYHLLPAFLENP